MSAENPAGVAQNSSFPFPSVFVRPGRTTDGCLGCNSPLKKQRQAFYVLRRLPFPPLSLGGVKAAIPPLKPRTNYLNTTQCLCAPPSPTPRERSPSQSPQRRAPPTPYLVPRVRLRMEHVTESHASGGEGVAVHLGGAGGHRSHDRALAHVRRPHLQEGRPPKARPRSNQYT